MSRNNVLQMSSPHFPLHFPDHFELNFLQALQDLKNVHVINLNSYESLKSSSNGIGDEVLIVLERNLNEKTDPINELQHMSDTFSDEQKKHIVHVMEKIPSLQTVITENSTLNNMNNMTTKKPYQYTVNELRELCKSHGLNSTGVKNLLIQRLQDNKFI